MVLLDKCYRPSESVVAREVAGEFILVPIRQKASEVESIYTLNGVAARIWALLDGSRSLADVCDQIVSEYEVEPAEAELDISELASQLLSIDALQEC